MRLRMIVPLAICWCAAGSAALCAQSSDSTSTFPWRPDTPRQRLHHGRTARRDRAHSCGQADRIAGTAGNRRQSTGCGWNDRNEDRRRSDARRTHAAGSVGLLCSGPGALCEAPLRSAQGPRGNHGDIQRGIRGGRAEFAGCQEHPGADRSRQIEARSAQLRLGGHRQRHTFRGGAFQGDGADRHRARPLQGHSRGGYRYDDRPRAAC